MEITAVPCCFKHALRNPEFRKPGEGTKCVFVISECKLLMGGRSSKCHLGDVATSKCKVILKQEPRVHGMSFHGWMWGACERIGMAVLIGVQKFRTFLFSRMCKGKGHASHGHRREINTFKKVNNVVPKNTAQDKSSG